MKDKVVIITGGTSGIGRALAFEFGMRGSLIVITGRNSEALHKTVDARFDLTAYYVSSENLQTQAQPVNAKGAAGGTAPATQPAK